MSEPDAPLRSAGVWFTRLVLLVIITAVIGGFLLFAR